MRSNFPRKHSDNEEASCYRSDGFLLVYMAEIGTTEILGYGFPSEFFAGFDSEFEQ